MDGLTIGATEDGDMRLFSGDSIEVLIETPVHSYYQLAVSPVGALVDLDRSEGIDPAWSSGAVVETHAGDDYWSVEMRIPIARPEDVDVDDRGVEGAKPTQDAPWHFNVCRLRVREDEKSTSAFSATGGGFHVVSRFAKLVAP